MFELVCDGLTHRRASPRLRARGSIALTLLATTLASGCMREPAPCLIELQEGDLVITEIRGPQDGMDTRGEWFELYNATDETLELQGLRGTLERLEGSAVDGQVGLTFLVREPLSIEPGAYVVLGTLPLHEGRRPELDYSVNDDFRLDPATTEVVAPDGQVVEIEVPPDENADPRALFDSARVRLWACDRLIDGVVYAGLPTCGTHGLDGLSAPDADDNDDPARWCDDARSPWCDEDEPITGSPPLPWGAPGSGGEANPPCP